MDIGNGFFAYLYVGIFGVGAVVGCVVALLARADGAAGDSDRVTLLHEIERSRRYARPVSLLHIPRNAVGGDGPLDEDTFGAIVRSLREIDFAWLGDGRAHVLLPECGRAEAHACLRRLAEATTISDPSRVHVATFPDDGVTTGALFRALSGEIEHLPADEVPAVVRGGGGAQPGMASA